MRRGLRCPVQRDARGVLRGACALWSPDQDLRRPGTTRIGQRPPSGPLRRSTGYLAGPARAAISNLPEQELPGGGKGSATHGRLRREIQGQAILKVVPFTLAHPAAAIPFRRTPLILSAMVMGCCVPDFPYFLFQSQHSAYGHTVAGLFVLDLPLALAALWVFHALIKEPMLLFLPAGMRRRLPASVNRFRFWPWQRFSLIVLSILTGSATHLGWDAFTHRDSWIYRHWAFLREACVLPAIGTMEMYKLLEYATSAAGLAVVAVWIWRWYRTTKPSAAPVARPGRRFAAGLPALAILGGAICAWHHDGMALQLRLIVHFTADLLMAAISLFLLGLLLYGVILRQRRAVPAPV